MGASAARNERERETKKSYGERQMIILCGSPPFVFFVWFAVRFRKLQLRLMSGGGLCSGCANSK